MTDKLTDPAPAGMDLRPKNDDGVVAWQWRHRDGHQGARWSEWDNIEMPIDEFCDLWIGHFERTIGKAQVEARPLYAHPPSQGPAQGAMEKALEPFLEYVRQLRERYPEWATPDTMEAALRSAPQSAEASDPILVLAQRLLEDSASYIETLYEQHRIGPTMRGMDCGKLRASAEQLEKLALSLRSPVVTASPYACKMPEGHYACSGGIYIASKTRHAARWKALRAEGYPIISTWIDEAGAGESANLDDLWTRCVAEAAGCQVLIVYREADDVLKGGWVEVGAALAAGVPVYAVGLEGFTIAKHKRLTHFATVEEAFRAAVAQCENKRSCQHSYLVEPIPTIDSVPSCGQENDYRRSTVEPSPFMPIPQCRDEASCVRHNECMYLGCPAFPPDHAALSGKVER